MEILLPISAPHFLAFQLDRSLFEILMVNAEDVINLTVIQHTVACGINSRNSFAVTDGKINL